MERNANKEKWIREVMESTTGIKRALPEPGLFEKVTTSLSFINEKKVIRIPLKQWAAAALLLLALNVGSVIYFTRQNNDTAKIRTDNPLAAQMQLETAYNY